MSTRYHRAATLIAALLLLPATARASDLARTDSLPHLFLTQNVTGTVVDSAGAPLANATVIAAEVGRSTTTNANGEFTLRGLPAGEYHLNVQLIGYAPGHVVVRVAATGPDIKVKVVMNETPLRLSSVIISATPTGTEAERMTQTAVALTGDALARSVSSSVAASLAAEPGVAQRYSGPAATMPVIRGLTGDRILVLQDGERAGDLASSSGDHAVSVDPLAAQRIEVVRGPASLLYGNNALGGVVNVISNDIPTEVPSHFEGTIGTQGESVTPGGALNIGVSSALGAKGAFSLRGGFRDMGALHTGGGEVLGGTDSRARNASMGYGYIGTRGTIGFAVRTYGFNYGIAAEPGDPEAGIRVDGRRIGLSAKGGLQLSSAALPYIRFEGTTQDYAHDEIESDGAVGTHFALRTQTLNAQATTAFGRLKGAFGMQGLFKQYEATGDEALTPAADSRGLGAFIFQEMALIEGRGHEEGHEGGVQLQFGARWDDYLISSKDGGAKFGPGRDTDFSEASGSLGLSWAVTDAVTLSGSMARAFRAPTVEELYSNGFHAAAGTYDVGDPSLRPEVSGGAEAILRLRGERVTAQFSTYVNRVDDYVTPVIQGDTLVDGNLVPLNRIAQADAQLSGVEGSLEARLGDAVVASLMGDLVRGELVADGSPLPFLPPARLGGGLRWEKGAFNASGEVRHGFAQDRVTGGNVDVATAAYTLVNLSAGTQWTVGNVLHRVTLRADNVGDVRYFDASSRIKRFAANPGRNISLVYQVAF